MNSFRKISFIAIVSELIIIVAVNSSLIYNNIHAVPAIERVETGELVSYYVHSNETNRSEFLIINFALILMFILSVSLINYLRITIIEPFNRMTNLTTELAKGNLSKPVEQEKSKYLNKFLWGIDMLREHLEDDKKKELSLQKENKTLILSISHDIKTPLSAIELYTKALKNNLYDNEEKKQEVLEGIEKNIVEIKGYVNEIVTASKEDFLNLSVAIDDFYLSAAINEITGYYAGKLSDLHTELFVESFSENMIHGDLDRVVEILQNLFENAIKYGDGNWIKMSFDDEEDCKLITVANSGASLKEEELIYLFDSFYRGSNVGTKEGSGLGLYIAKTLAHMMDGDIFASINDEVFSVTLVLEKS